MTCRSMAARSLVNFAVFAWILACDAGSGLVNTPVSHLKQASHSPDSQAPRAADSTRVASRGHQGAFSAKPITSDSGAAARGEVAEREWVVRVVRPTPLLRANDSGCLETGGTMLSPGEELAVLASDGVFVLVDDAGDCLKAEDVTEVEVPLVLPAGPRGVVRYTTQRYAYDATGCPQAIEVLEEHAEVETWARSYDLNYRGFVVIGRDLSLAPVRHVDGEGLDGEEWVYPWHSSVQLVKEVEGGFVIGGGVIVGPDAILTAAHLGVDGSWCFSREPNSGEAWANGEFVCGTIAGPAEKNPEGVDVAIAHLSVPVDPPYSVVRTDALKVDEAFFVAKWSYLQQNAFADSTVDSVGNDNAFCQRWPQASSFISADPILEGGDSGGPAWVGDELVGIVHGDKCYMGRELIRWWLSGKPAEHILVHVPGIYEFIEPAL